MFRSRARGSRKSFQRRARKTAALNQKAPRRGGIRL